MAEKINIRKLTSEDLNKIAKDAEQLKPMLELEPDMQLKTQQYKPLGYKQPEPTPPQFDPVLGPNYIKNRKGVGICIITRGTVPVKWMMHMNRLVKFNPGGLFWKFIVVERLSWAAARSECVRRCRAHNFRYLLFVDDDVFLPDDAIDRMLKSKKDIVSGVYWTKTEHTSPVIFKEMGAGPMYEFPVDELIEIGGSGLGACLINMDVFDKFDEQGIPYFVENWIYTTPDGIKMRCPIGEDHYFFIKAKELGYKTYADTGILCDHYDYKNDIFYPGEKIVRDIVSKKLKKEGRQDVIDAVSKSQQDPTKKTIIFYNQSMFAGDELDRRGVGGAETSIIYLARELYKSNYNVRVYSDCLRPGRYDGVWYKHYRDFHKDMTDLNGCDSLIISREQAILLAEPDLKQKYNIKQLVLWAHDMATDPAWVGFEVTASKFDTVVMLSEFHKNELFERYPGIASKTNFVIIGNGVNSNLYKKDIKKIKGRCIYSSTPFRGLDLLLEMWPQIKKRVPYAELYIFSSIKHYGEQYDDSPWDCLYTAAKQMPGVVYHGSVLQSRLAEEQLKAELLLYPNTFKETYCLVGDTRIAIPGGYKHLSDIKKGDLVFGYSHDKKRISLGKVKNWFLTHKNAPIYKVNYSWGIGSKANKTGYIKATADHPILMYDGDYKGISNLKPRDRLMPFYRGIEKRFGYLTLNLTNGKQIYEHDLIAKDYLGMEGNLIVHHKDGNTSNNHPSNLKIMSQSDHARLHYSNLSELKKLSLANNISNKLKSFLGTEEGKLTWSKTQKKRWSKLTQQEKSELVKKQREGLSNKSKKNQVSALIKSNKKKTIKLPKKELIQLYIDDKKSMLAISKYFKVSDRVVKKNLDLCGIHVRGRREAQLIMQNHIVESIEFSGFEDVYDIEVEGIHNFVANDLIVHNCITAAECQTAGTPIITTRLGALPETVKPNCGILIDADPYSIDYQNQFIETAVRLLSDEIDHMSQECLKHDFSWSTRAKEWGDQVFSKGAPTSSLNVPNKIIGQTDSERDAYFKQMLEKEQFGYDEYKYNLFKQFISQDYKVLVVNCGLGELPRFLKKSLPKAEIWGSEESLFALDYCRQTNKQIYFANHPVSNIEFESEYFDVIIVENFDRVKDKETFMQHIDRIRASKSVMIATVPISYWNPNQIKKFFKDSLVIFHSSKSAEIIFSVRWLAK